MIQKSDFFVLAICQSNRRDQNNETESQKILIGISAFDAGDNKGFDEHIFITADLYGSLQDVSYSKIICPVSIFFPHTVFWNSASGLLLSFEKKISSVFSVRLHWDTRFGIAVKVIFCGRSFNLSKYFALDIGTSLTKIFERSKKKYIVEPTIAAVDRDSSKLIAFGRDALSIIDQTPGKVKIVKPIRHGHIEDLSLAGEIITYLLKKAGHSKFGRSYVLASTYGDTTNVQRRAMVRSLKEAGVKEARFLESTIAAAIDLDLPIGEPVGNMVVIFGAGCTESAVLSLGATVTSASIGIGAGDIDNSLKNYFIRRHNINASTLLFSNIRENIIRDSQDAILHVITGHDIHSGEVVSMDVSAEELWSVIDEALLQIVDGIMQSITSVPPDLTNDLCQSGIYLVGGLAKLDGLGVLLGRKTDLPIHISKNPELRVVGGLRRSLDNFSNMTKA